MAKADLKTYNPFPGLRPFREEEVYLFFGRKRRVNKMVDKLADTHFLTVVGSSGSGKSSLVNCGLLPALHQGRMADAGTAWKKAHFRPENDPIGKMARALAGKTAGDLASKINGAPPRKGGLFSGTDTGRIPLEIVLETTLRRSKLGLVEVYQKARLPEHVNLLVVVDQFEELFRYAGVGGFPTDLTSGMGNDATAFVNLLLEAKTQALEAGYPIYVVITMRSDYLGDCARFADLPEAINEGQYLVPRMTRGERRDAIKGPIAVGGAQIDKSATIAAPLLTRLVNDIGDNPDQLSIMQHALNRTWDHWLRERNGEGAIDLAHYEHIGTMAHALNEHAKRAYAELGDTKKEKDRAKQSRKQQICERIFKALTFKGPDARGVRRPTRLGNLCDIVDASQPEVEDVMRVFRKPSRSFLMPPSEDPDALDALDADDIIDISHESLMRVWKRLGEWVDGEAESARVYSRLAETAVLWKAGDETLLRGPQLQRALNWQEETQPTEAWAKHYHSEYKLAIRFLEKSKTRSRWMQVALWGIAAILVLVTLYGFRYLSQKQLIVEAQEQRDIAIDAATRADSAAREAILARDEADSSAAQAILARDDADSAAADARRQQAVAEFQRALADSLLINVLAAQKATQAALAATGQARDSLLATASLLRAALAEAQRVKDEAVRRRQSTIGLDLSNKSVRQQQGGDPEQGALLAREAYRFNESLQGDHLNEVYDALRRALNKLDDAGGPVDVDAQHQGWVRAVAYSPNGDWIASAGNDGNVYLTRSETSARAKVLKGHKDALRSLTFSPDGTRLVTVDENRRLEVWRGLDDKPKGRLLEHRASLAQAFTFGGKGGLLALGDKDGRVLLFDPATGEERPVAGHHDEPVNAVAFSPDSTTLASGDLTGVVYLWNVADGALLYPPPLGNVRAVEAMAFSSDGKWLAIGDEAGIVRLWNRETNEIRSLMGHNGPVNAVAFSPDGATLATGSGDNSVRLWDLDRPEVPVILSGHTDWVLSVAFSPDGSQLISAGADRVVLRWNIDAKQLADEICSSVGRLFRREEWNRFVGQDIPYDSTYVPCPAVYKYQP